MSDYYKGKRVLVTGADGFMGSHLVDALIALGAYVSIFVRGNSVTGTHVNTLKNLLHCKEKLEHIIAGDIGSPDAVMMIKDIAPQIIFHLAADAYVPKSFKQPLEVHRTNATGTLYVLQAAMDAGVERVVVTSSSEIYGHCSGAIDELTELRPTSPYGASKVSADRYAFAYHVTYKLPVAIIRPFNTYGPRHTYDVIPKFIALACAGEDITIYGDGTQTRDLSYVDDTVRGFLIMGEHEKAIGRAVNFGSGVDVTVNEVAHLVKEYTRSTSNIVHIDARMSEVQTMRCNPALAFELFGYTTSVDIKEGIRKNVEWFFEKVVVREKHHAHS